MLPGGCNDEVIRENKEGRFYFFEKQNRPCFFIAELTAGGVSWGAGFPGNAAPGELYQIRFGTGSNGTRSIVQISTKDRITSIRFYRFLFPKRSYDDSLLPSAYRKVVL